MVDYRLYYWQLIIIAFILTFPLIKKIIARGISQIQKQYFKFLIMALILESVLQILYLNSIIGDTEYLYLQLLVVLYFMNTGFNATTLIGTSPEIDIKRFNLAILRKIVKAFGGSNPEEENGIIQFSITTPLRISYIVTAVEKKFTFTSNTTNTRLSKILLIITLYLSTDAVVTNSENVKIPLIGSVVSSILAIITVISIVTIYTIHEYNNIVNFSNEFPDFYKKALRKAALNKNTETDGDSPKDKAKALLERREISRIQAKQQELHGKISDIFESDVEKKLDPKSVERLRLINTVKRIVLSTPPWKSVKIENIAHLAKGNIDEVEIILAKLIEKKEVLGVYDIWEKEFHGKAVTQWKQTKKILKEVDNLNLVKSLKVYPDGSSEVYLASETGDENE